MNDNNVRKQMYGGEGLCSGFLWRVRVIINERTGSRVHAPAFIFTL